MDFSFTLILEGIAVLGIMGAVFGAGDMAAAVIDRIVHHGRTSGSIASRTTTVMFW